MRRRSGWWHAGFGIVLLGLTVAPVHGLHAVPLAATALLTCAVLALPRLGWSRRPGRGRGASQDPQLDS